MEADGKTVITKIATNPTAVGPAAPSSEIDQSVLSKYGYQAMAAGAGAFATSFAVGTVQKHIITNITRPLIFGPNNPKEEVGSSASGNEADDSSLPTNPMEVETVQNTSSFGDQDIDPVMNEYLTKYGNPKDPNATGRSMVQSKDETADLTINDETEVDYSTADAQDFQEVGAVDCDFGGVDDTLTDVGTEEGGIVDLIGGIVGMFTSGGEV